MSDTGRGMGDEFRIIAEASLNRDTTHIKQDLQDISKRIGKDKSTRLRVRADLDTKSLEQQTKRISEKLKKAKAPRVFENFGKTMKDASVNTAKLTRKVEQLNRDAQALSTTSKIDLISDREMERVSVYRENLTTLRKEMQRFDESGAQTGRETTVSVDKAQAQTQMYKNLKNIISDIHRIEKEMIGAQGETKNFLKRQRAERERIKQEYQEEIKANNLKSKEMERQLKLQQSMHNVQQKIRSEKTVDKRSAEAYKQLTNHMKEEYALRRNIVKAEGESAEILQRRLRDTQQAKQSVQDSIGTDKLTNQQRYLEYVEQEKREIAKLNQLDTERAQKQRERLNKQTQQEAYKQIKSDLKEIHRIEQQLVNYSGEQRGNLEQKRSEMQERVRINQQLLDNNNLRIQSKDEEIRKEQELRRIQLAIKSEKGTEAQSRRSYEEIYKIEQERSKLKRKMMNVTAKEREKLDRIRETLRQSAQAQKEITRNSNLYNVQREYELQKKIKKLRREEAVESAKVQGRDELRVQRMGTKVGSVDTSGRDFSNIDQMRNFIQEISGSNAKITQVKNNIDSLGNQTIRFTRTTELANGQLQEQKLVLDKNTQSLYKQSEAMRPNINRLLGFAEQMRIAVVRSVQWGLAMGALYGNLRRLRDGIDVVRNLDKELTQVAITTGQTRQETRYLGEEYSRLAVEMAKTVDEIASVNTELVRQGLSIEESQRRLQTVLKLSASAGLETNETLSIITSSVNALGEEAETTADVLLRSGQISASSAGQIGEALTKVASSAKATDMSLQEITATISTLVEVTQESPSSLGNSMKTILARFNQINEETGEVNSEFNNVQRAFESVGVTFLDAEGQIRPVYDLLADLSGKWEDLDRNTRMYISTQSAGKQFSCQPLW